MDSFEETCLICSTNRRVSAIDLAMVDLAGMLAVDLDTGWHIRVDPISDVAAVRTINSHQPVATVALIDGCRVVRLLFSGHMTVDELRRIAARDWLTG